MSTAAGLPAEAAAFDLGSGPVSVLCLHGLTATPGEVRPVAQALSARGLRAVGPLLPGHGTTPEELAALPYGAWLDCARSELDRLQAQSDRTYLVGSSLGGLLSLALAAQHRVDGVAVVGVPLAFGWHKEWLPGLLKHVRPFLPKRGGPDIRDVEAHGRHVCYPVMPLASVVELVRLQRVVRASLSRITAPLLVAHGRHDSTASVRDAEALRAGVASERCEVRIYERSGHIVTMDHDGPDLCAAIVEFFAPRA